MGLIYVLLYLGSLVLGVFFAFPLFMFIVMYYTLKFFISLLSR